MLTKKSKQFGESYELVEDSLILKSFNPTNYNKDK